MQQIEETSREDDDDIYNEDQGNDDPDKEYGESINDEENDEQNEGQSNDDM